MENNEISKKYTDATEKSEYSSIELLLASLNDLEKIIWNARITVSRKNLPAKGIVERLDSYDAVLGRQKSLAKELVKHIEMRDWDETNRHISLINGLSILVRDDAKALLETLDTATSVDESLIC